jgi:hypothetical protein
VGRTTPLLTVSKKINAIISEFTRRKWATLIHNLFSCSSLLSSHRPITCLTTSSRTKILHAFFQQNLLHVCPITPDTNNTVLCGLHNSCYKVFLEKLPTRSRNSQPFIQPNVHCLIYKSPSKNTSKFLSLYNITWHSFRPTLKLQDHSLSVVRDRLFIIFEANILILTYAKSWVEFFKNLNLHYFLNNRSIWKIVQRLLKTLQGPERLWGPSSLLPIGYRGLFSGSKVAGTWSWLLTSI